MPKRWQMAARASVDAASPRRVEALKSAAKVVGVRSGVKRVRGRIGPNAERHAANRVAQRAATRATSLAAGLNAADQRHFQANT